MGGREHEHLGHLVEHLAGHRVDPEDALDLVAPELDSDDGLLVGREHLQRVPPDPELPPHEVDLVSLILDVDEALDRLGHRVLDALDHPQQLTHVLLGEPSP